MGIRSYFDWTQREFPRYAQSMIPTMTPIDAQIDILHQTSKIVSSGQTLDEMLKALIRLAAQVTASDACLVYLVEPTGEIVLRASQLPHVREIGNIRMHPGEGVTGWVAAHKSVVALSSNAFADKRFKIFPSLVEDTYEAFLSVPLVSGGDVTGVINVYSAEERNFSEEDVRVLSTVADQAALAIENTKLMTEAQESQEALQTRKLVDRAKSILQRQANLSEDESYRRLQQQSMRTRRSMREIAEAVIMASEMQSPEKPAE